jgi:hypothetical protein
MVLMPLVPRPLGSVRQVLLAMHAQARAADARPSPNGAAGAAGGAPATADAAGPPPSAAPSPPPSAAPSPPPSAAPSPPPSPPPSPAGCEAASDDEEDAALALRFGFHV